MNNKEKIQELEDEWKRLDDSFANFPPSPESMNYYAERVRSIMTEINELKKN